MAAFDSLPEESSCRGNSGVADAQGVTEKKVGDTTLAKHSTHCKTLKSGVGALPGPLAAEIWCVKV